MNDEIASTRAQVHGESLHAIPARVLASWQRSESYGVPLDDVVPTFAGTYDDESLFFECGREVLNGLHSTLTSEPVGLMLTDADGLVLNRLCGDSELQRNLDRVHLAPGFSYSEQAAGTNGLGLALADRVPALVKADDHYAQSLCGYTCAAAPVFDPVSGRLEGAVNLTTWSDSRSDLLLALAQMAASSTANLLLARSQGHRRMQPSRGQVFRVEPLVQQIIDSPKQRLSAVWEEVVERARTAAGLGRIVTAVGEWGSGRASLLGEAYRQALAAHRLFAVRAPAPQDIDTWMQFWTPELARTDTTFVICNVDEIPPTAAARLRDLLVNAAASGSRAVALTAERLGAIPAPLSDLVDAVVDVPPLRERPSDIAPLAEAFAHRERGRRIEITPPAMRALSRYSWPGNVAELRSVVKSAASRTDAVEVRHLPAEVVADGGRLPPIRAFERDELVRVLTRPGVTIEKAAAELGMSRATVYRKVAQYGITLARSRPDRTGEPR